jgi:hypothetical protein
VDTLGYNKVDFSSVVDGQNSVLPLFWSSDNISDWSNHQLIEHYTQPDKRCTFFGNNSKRSSLNLIGCLIATHTSFLKVLTPQLPLDPRTKLNIQLAIALTNRLVEPDKRRKITITFRVSYAEKQRL